MIIVFNFQKYTLPQYVIFVTNMNEYLQIKYREFLILFTATFIIQYIIKYVYVFCCTSFCYVIVSWWFICLNYSKLLQVSMIYLPFSDLLASIIENCCRLLLYAVHSITSSQQLLLVLGNMIVRMAVSNPDGYMQKFQAHNPSKNNRARTLRIFP